MIPFQALLSGKYGFRAINLLTVIANIVTIVGVVFAAYTYYQGSSDARSTEIAFCITILIMLFACSIHIYTFYKKKMHLYIEIGSYMHHIGHIMRDSISNLEYECKCGTINQNIFEKEFKSLLDEILGVISKLFTLVTNTNCAVSIKVLNEDKTIKTYIRDSYSRIERRTVDEAQVEHTLEGNTDFDNLFFSKEGCDRFFICNDLPKLWKKGYYKSTSFAAIRRDPKVIPIGSYRIICEWPLNYKSTMVFPIRWILNSIPPDNLDVSSDGWRYFGFLCIDSRKKILLILTTTQALERHLLIYYIYLCHNFIL